MLAASCRLRLIRPDRNHQSEYMNPATHLLGFLSVFLTKHYRFSPLCQTPTAYEILTRLKKLKLNFSNIKIKLNLSDSKAGARPERLKSWSAT